MSHPHVPPDPVSAHGPHRAFQRPGRPRPLDGYAAHTKRRPRLRPHQDDPRTGTRPPQRHASSLGGPHRMDPSGDRQPHDRLARHRRHRGRLLRNQADIGNAMKPFYGRGGRERADPAAPPPHPDRGRRRRGRQGGDADAPPSRKRAGSATPTTSRASWQRQPSLLEARRDEGGCCASTCGSRRRRRSRASRGTGPLTWPRTTRFTAGAAHGRSPVHRAGPGVPGAVPLGQAERDGRERMSAMNAATVASWNRPDVPAPAPVTLCGRRIARVAPLPPRGGRDPRGSDRAAARTAPPRGALRGRPAATRAAARPRRRARRHRDGSGRRRADERAPPARRLPRRQPFHHLGLQVRVARGRSQAAEARVARPRGSARAGELECLRERRPRPAAEVEQGELLWASRRRSTRS